MLRSWQLGNAFGIPLRIHWSFLLLPLWALFLHRSEGLAAILFGEVVLISLFGCVLLHELGHALMARFFGIRTRDITLYPIGGVARLESTGNRPHEEICIALAGPAVNLIIVLLLAPFVIPALMSGLVPRPEAALSGVPAGPVAMLAYYLTALWLGNGVLLMFNLLPVFPMDGGRVFRGLLAIGLGQVRATEIAAAVALVLAGGLALLGLYLFNPVMVLVSLFVIFVGQQERAALRMRERRPDLFEPVVPGVDVTPIVRTPSEFLPHRPLFTGLLWDRERCVWVRWVDGRPVEIL